MMKRDVSIKKVSDFLRRIGRRKLWIQTHDIPDPDAIASAEALRVIARDFGLNASIVINGFPNRRENTALIKECKIHLKPLESLRIRSAEQSAWAYVDCLPYKGNVTMHPLAPGDLYLAIDHHGKPETDEKNGVRPFIIHEPGVGATATLLTRMLLRMHVPFPPRLASALSYAIITDTLDFSREVSEADLEMYSALFPYTNQKIISRLRNAPKTREYFQIMHRALENASFYRNIAWADIGVVQSGESVAEMADLILSTERITWSLALGHNEGKMFLSLRSSQPKSRCSRVIHRIVRDLSGTVGGHNEFAGGFVFLEKGDDPTEVADTVTGHFLRTVLHLSKKADIPEGTPLVER